MKQSGIEFVFIRVGYRGYGTGKLCLDSKFHEYIKGAKASGLKVGVYFFSQAINESEAREEAAFVLKELEGYSLDCLLYTSCAAGNTGSCRAPACL